MCCDPGNIQGQAEPGSENLDLAVGFPVHCSGVELDGLQWSLPTQQRICFYNSVK